MTDLPVLPPRYVATRLLGEGATGSVYQAEDRLVGGHVALKIVRANLAIHARFRSRFAHEVALSARVAHPRVVPVLDHGALSDGRPFVSMAYADQGSLEDRLQSGLPLSEALRLMDQVLDALGFLHARGYLHQDLKPGNVLLYTGDPGRGGRVPQVDAWVADLGVTEALTALTMDRKGISGTPVWMAPEQLSGRSQDFGPWTDLYALGLILLAMLGGLGPDELEARSPADLLRSRSRLKVKLRAGLPESLTRVVEALLDPEPRQRYDRASDVRRALHEALIALSPELRVAELPRQPIIKSRTSFPDSFLPEGQMSIVAPRPEDGKSASFRWNRVQPDPMPAPAPPEPAADPRSRASLALLALREPPLIGRQEQRQRLWSMAREVARSGQPQVAIVVGQAGTGKSRLVESLAEALEQHGYMETVTLRYHVPAGAHDGYRGAVRELLAPWNETRSQIEERLVRWLARDWQVPREAVADEAMQLARWCGSLRDGETPIHAAAGLAYLYRFLDARAWRGGAALVLDDVHHCQTAGDGLAICEALLRGTVGHRPVFVMATVSAEALAGNPGLAAQVEDLERLGAVRIEAPRLSDDEILRLLVESCRLDKQLANALAPRCQGSPSFAVLVLRDWAARRLLVLQPDISFALRPGVRLSEVLPPDIESLCQSRVEGAVASAEDPAGAQSALGVVALAGQEPPTLVVRAVCAGGLDALLATGLVRQRGWRLVFEHVDVQRAAWRLAENSSETPEHHQQLADAWAALGRRTGTDVDLPLGLHRLHADRPAEAVRPLLRAGHSALIEGRPNTALDAAHFAAVAADRLDGTAERYDARCLQAEALLELERADEAIAQINNARRLGRLTERQNARLQVLLAQAAILKGSLGQAWKLMELAETSFLTLRDRGGLAETTAGFGRLCRLMGRPDEAVVRFRQLLDLRYVDARGEVDALKEIIECAVGAGRAEGMDLDVTRLRQAAQRSGDTRCLAQATYATGLLLLHRGQLPEAERHLRTARALAATLGAEILDLLCQQNLGASLAAGQQDQAAAQVFDEAARFAEERGWGDSAAVAHLHIALLALRRGAERRMVLETDRANQLLQSWPQHWSWGLVGVLRALVSARAGDGPATAAWWQVARERVSGHRLFSADLGLALQQLADAAARRGWRDIASQAVALVPGASASLLPPEDEPSLIIDLPASRSASLDRNARGLSADLRTFLPDEEPPSRGKVGQTWMPDDDSGAKPLLPPPGRGPRAPDDEPPRRRFSTSMPSEDIATDEVPTRRR